LELNLLIPSLLIAEVYPEGLRRPGDVLAALREAASAGFYGRCEIPILEDSVERAQARAVVAESGIKVTCWPSDVFRREQIDLSSSDRAKRARSVARTIELMDLAAECGADNFGVLSGPNPGESKKSASLAAFAESLVTLGRAAERNAGMRVALEPLDHEAHKKALVGPITMAIRLVSEVRDSTKSVFLGWDSGHAALNGEDVVESMRQAAPYTCQLHLSNPVLDRADPLFGDHHYPIGGFGAGTSAEFERILAAAKSCPFPCGPQISVAIEVRTQDGRTPGDTLRDVEQLMRSLLSTDIGSAKI
jgi:sugar phosphate isomerase/epimerase